MKKRSKKEENHINELKNDLNSMLFRALGYELDAAGYVIDQEELRRLTYRNRSLKYPISGTYIPLHSRDILFDPCVNRALSEQLFTTFMHKEEVDNDIYMKMYSFTPTDTGTYVEVLTEDMDTGEMKMTRSDLYAVISLCYLDLILNIYSNGMDTQYKAVLRELEGYLKDDLQ